MKLAPLTLALFSSFSMQQSIAQDDTMESEVERIQVFGSVNKFGALKSDTPLLETARSVSIVSSEQIVERGALTLDDALTYSSGVQGEVFGLGTRGDFFQVRGFDALEYRDGMQSLSGNYNNTRTEVYTLEQVEVLKGPASVLFGPGAPGGIVNLVTKQPGKDTGSEVVFELGNHNRKQVSTDLSLNSDDNRWQSRFVALYRDSQTQISDVNDDAIVIAPSIAYQPNDATRVTVLVDYTNRDSDTAHQFLPINGTLYPHASGQVIDSTVYHGQPGFNRFDTESWAVTLLAEHRLNETWSVDLSSRYRDGESEYRQTWISFTGDALVPRSFANGVGPRSWYQQDGFSEQFQVDARARANFYTGDISHRILLGVSHQKIDSRNDTSFLYGLDFSTGTPIPVGGILNIFDPVYSSDMPNLPPLARGTDSEDRINGFYAHNQMEYNNWIANIGIRFDDTENQVDNTESSDNATSLSASLMYQFQNGFAPYVNYAESFTPVPGIDSVTGNPLLAEEGEQVEMGFKWSPRGTSHLFTFAYFDAELSNLPNPAALPIAPSQQEGISAVEGYEFEAKLSYQQVALDLNLTRLDSQDPDGFQRASVPESLASMWINFTPDAIDGLKTGIGARYVGQSESGGFSLATGIPARLNVVTPSYTMIDLYAEYEWAQWMFSANIRNATDKDGYATCLSRGDCFPVERRVITVRAAYRF